MKKMTCLTTFVVIWIGFAGCTGPTDLSPDSPLTKTEARTDSAALFSEEEFDEVTLPNGLVLGKKDSMYVFQGDMMLTSEQVEIIGAPQTRGGFRRNPVRYWPKRTVYYKFTDGFMLPQDKEGIEVGIQYWRDNTCLKFVKLKSNQTVPNYVEFVSDSWSHSNVGMVGGRQEIAIQTLYGSDRHIVVHEIGHTIGMYHEHNRADRDQFLKIYWDNIDPKHVSDYQKYDGSEGTEVAGLDINSMMIYGSYDNGIDKKLVMERRVDGAKFSRANNNILSSGDKASITAMYGPPFPKLKTVLYEVNQDYHDYATEKWDYTYNNTIEFYADTTYTVKAKLPWPRHLLVHYVSSAGQNEYIDVRVPWNVDSYSLGYTTSRGWYDYNECKELFYDNYYVDN